MGNCLEGAEMKHGMLNKNDMWSQFHSSCLPCYILNTQILKYAANEAYWMLMYTTRAKTESRVWATYGTCSLP